MRADLSWPGTLLAAAALRVALIAYGSWHDAGFELQYTDVDYYVFVDGAELLANQLSPLHRQTYRYTPLLAALLAPGLRLHSTFGKLLFGAADVVAGCVMRRLLELRGAAAADSTRAAVLLLFNPLCIAVSSRGNADALHVLALLAALLIFERAQRADVVSRRRGLEHAAALLALATHLKPFVIVHVPSFLCACCELNSPRGHSQSSKAGSCHPSRWRRPARFLASFVGCSAVLSLLASLACGAKYWHEALLHHLRRSDAKHNFSPYFYPLYLLPGLGLNDGASLLLALLPFAPQAMLMLLLAWRLHADLPRTCFLQASVPL